MKKTKGLPPLYRKPYAHAAKHARMKPALDDSTEAAIVAYLAEMSALNHALMVKIAITSEALRAVELWISEQEMVGRDVSDLDDILGAFYDLLETRRTITRKRRARRKSRQR